jgi:hypothetical protein
VLRTLVMVFACALLIGGAALLLFGLLPPGLYCLGLGALIFIGTRFERWRYRRYESTPDASWQATGERFVDPGSGRDVEVFYDPKSGERRYVQH